MTELHFKGKEFVYNHHLAVPHRPLVPDVEKSVGTPDLDGNLIIQGDNLHALKSLLPLYASKVDCIFIDPPYNTGNECWRYNDNVNAPMIKEWLAENPVGVDDGLRHDKWCAMMWPRLKLLHELLAEDGVMFICIDDNELYRLNQMMSEIFGEANFICSLIVQSNPRGRTLDKHFAKTHEYILVFAKDYLTCQINQLPKDEAKLKDYRYEDDQGKYRLLELRNRNPVFNRQNRPNLFFPIYVNEKTGEVTTESSEASLVEVYPRNSKNEDGCWTWGKPKATEENDLLIGRKTQAGIWRIFRKDYIPTTGATTMAKTLWLDSKVNNENGKELLGQIFGKPVFDFPKSAELVANAIKIGTKPNSIVLDSFAGSGTTAHAVLETNKLDGGKRKFILVEMEEYADGVTAERIRRVINGYEFTGKQTTELYQKKLTWSALQREDFIPSSVLGDIINQHGTQFDRIYGDVNKDNTFIISGTNDIEERVEGFGGAFTYCTLGDSIELEGILTGKNLPAYDALAPVLFHMATNKTLTPTSIAANEFYVGESDDECVWMIYRPNLEWLKSDEAALTLTRAKTFAAKDKGKRHLVFAPSRFVSQKILKAEGLNIDFVPFPDALYRIERD